MYWVKENDNSNVRKCVGLYMARNGYSKILSGKWIEFLEALGRSSFKNPQIEPLFNTSVVMGHSGLHMDHPQFFVRLHLIPLNSQWLANENPVI